MTSSPQTRQWTVLGVVHKKEKMIIEIDLGAKIITIKQLITLEEFNKTIGKLKEAELVDDTWKIGINTLSYTWPTYHVPNTVPLTDFTITSTNAKPSSCSGECLTGSDCPCKVGK